MGELVNASSAGFVAAADRFAQFFKELARGFVEREDLLAQIALALLSREHVLMTGPPGTAKSGVATAVLGRILDEKTGRPSVFARQFTESTVQTDLVGPIDFKTLMQTGRTEHFTDEGMLGAVHAFLDEVLDGRDMLLRTTLNVLNERELKEGTKTTKGRIECALMTTNRYLAEVLESSRETLLAFVDRIAFVSFVPKGFADSSSLGRVLRAQVGGTKPPVLRCLLTIQDLDVLQAVTERIPVPEEICDSLVNLLGQVDADLAAASKADPTFQATRYLSTRTAVRLGRVLRAVCVYDRILGNPTRPLEVLFEDLALLRLSLMLSGPSPTAMKSLIARETDPRERRQLQIMRTEREIFDRALARVVKPTKKPRAEASIDVGALAEDVAAANAGSSKLANAVDQLAKEADGTGPNAEAAATLLSSALGALVDRAVADGLTAGTGPDESVADVVARLADLATNLDASAGTTRPVARWLRGRAVTMLQAQIALAPAATGAALAARHEARATLEQAEDGARVVLERVERAKKEIAELRSLGADASDNDSDAENKAISRIEGEVAEALDVGFRGAVEDALSRVEGDQLGPLLATLAPAIALVERLDARLAALGARAGALKARVVGPRLLPLVQAAFERLRETDRLALVEQVGRLFSELDRGGLLGAMSATSLLELAARALAREDEANAPPTNPNASLGGYRSLRDREQRVPIAFTLVEIALKVRPPTNARDPETLVRELGKTIGGLTAALQEELASLDLARVERATSLLEAWWAQIEPDARDTVANGDASQVEGALYRLGEGRFFHVTRDEGALVRFSLEAKLVADLFPEARARADALRQRLTAIEETSNAALAALRKSRADLVWNALLAPTSVRVASPDRPA